MPNKIKVTKQDILETSLAIARKDGIDSVNARSIAKLLNCSTQPVYYHFPTMDELRQAIKLEARSLYNDYISESKKVISEIPFKEAGMAFIQFASDEPNLFRILFMDNDSYEEGANEEIDDNYEYFISTIINGYHVSRDAAIHIYENVWISTHGLATMIVTGFMKFSKERISKLLGDVFRGQLSVYGD